MGTPWFNRQFSKARISLQGLLSESSLGTVLADRRMVGAVARTVTGVLADEYSEPPSPTGHSPSPRALRTALRMRSITAGLPVRSPPGKGMQLVQLRKQVPAAHVVVTPYQCCSKWLVAAVQVFTRGN
jgi:hypothetical protein